MNKDKFIKVVGLAVAAIFFLAWVDVNYFVPLNKTLGTLEQANALMSMFWLIAAAIFAVKLGLYYFFTRDKSETLALGMTIGILIWSGLEDIFYYLIKGLPLFNESMTWLNNNVFMSTVAKYLFNSNVVTGQSLVASVLIGFAIIIIINKFLLEMDD